MGLGHVCSDVLTIEGLPNVPHYPIHAPKTLLGWHKTEGNSDTIQRLIMNIGFPSLVKQNGSSNGLGVFLVRNATELEGVISDLFKTNSVLCLSPFRQVLNEFRCIILDGECLLTYEKMRPSLTGDGRQKTIDLLLEFLALNKSTTLIPAIFDPSFTSRLDDIPANGEKIYLQWKHNASIGTSYRIVSDVKLEVIACKAAKAIDARFVSVDIARSRQYSFEILEVNGTVIMNVFATISESHRRKSLEVYTKAIKKMFKIT